MPRCPVVEDPVPHLPGQIQPFPILLQDLHHTNALPEMSEPQRADFIQNPLPRVTEGCVSEVMPKRDGIAQIVIEPERLRDRPGKLGDLQRMCQTSTVMVAHRCNKDLRLMCQPAKRLAVQNPVAVSLVDGSDIALRLLPIPSFRISRMRRIRAENLVLPFFRHLADGTFPIHPGTSLQTF